MNTHDLIPPHGGFRKLRSFQCAQVVYDGTVIFCDRFIDKKSRIHDHMVQAARSGGFTERMYNARKSYRNNR